MKTLEEVRQEMLAKVMGRPLAKYSLKDADGRIVVSSNAPSQHAFTDPKMRHTQRAITSYPKDLSEMMVSSSNIGSLSPVLKAISIVQTVITTLQRNFRNLMTNLSKSVTNKKLEESAMLESLTLISMFSSRTLLCSQRLRQRDLN